MENHDVAGNANLPIGTKAELPTSQIKFTQKQLLSARNAVHKLTVTGLLPKASARRCVDCGLAAHDYDHYLGYERENWLSVEPVCRSCHAKRTVRRDRGKIEMPEQLREYNRKYAIIRRVKLRKKKICTTCGVNRPERGYVTCRGCIDLRLSRLKLGSSLVAVD